MSGKEKRQFRHIFLTGEKQIGKSTLLGKLRKELCQKYHLTETGFETRPYEINGSCRGHYLHGLVPGGAFHNDCPVTIRLGGGRMVFVTETFETSGKEILQRSLKLSRQKPVLLVMDEIGKAERDALGFQRQVLECLDEAPYAVGVLRKGDHRFLKAIARRPDVAVYTVTRENRNTLLETILYP